MVITIIQSELYWQNPAANRAMFEEKIWQIDQPTDLIVLPEMFTTGFSMSVQPLAEPMNLTTHKWMQQMAAQTGAVVTGSFICVDKGQYFNRLLWVEPDGTYDYYDKRHLFRMAEEHHSYTAGERLVVKEWKGWKIAPFICYDLRFPVWSRNLHQAYDLALYVANWPEARRSPWRTLLKARAIENLSYVVGVNRVGKDDNGITYSGDSAIVDFKGEVLFEKTQDEIIYTKMLDKAALERFREKFPAHLDADEFVIAAHNSVER
ncbi:amidohydrolase [Microscilla marina]|uniref:Omega-amidase YafV n=1 Tax=Microscilla marina ATCC 23134 TaxID=313606 RepID=A1ZJ78_MICM2|nr:amidohydrolase [Microscilla marina]EAY29614.1 hydrolase [Microscilla marina ATCC 23134]